MNRRTFIQTTLVASSSLCLAAPKARAESPKEAGKIGKMETSEFKSVNKAASSKVAALKPGGDPLSDADQKLFTEIALGGMFQLVASQMASERAKNADVKMIAEAEIEEQIGLSIKLKEIAAAKKASLPGDLDAKGKTLADQLKGLTGQGFERAYLKHSGVEGHESLRATMEKVEKNAADGTLKNLAAAALPLIRTHLQVSRDELSDLA